MITNVLSQLRQGLLVSTSLGLLAIVHHCIRNVQDDDERTPLRMLYESDDDKKCLEDEVCRFVLGLTLLVTTPLVIFWNEHQFVKLETLYKTAKRYVHDLQSAKFTPSADMDGKFVCFTGRLKGGTTLSDGLFPCIQVDNALLLRREIEIYQYVQVSKGDNGYQLKEKWCKLPQPDPSKFPDKKNNNGNWDLFADNSRMMDTGHKFQGEPVQFGDNVLIFRAPNPTIGEIAIPQALMNEAFLGERHVHRLAELELIKRSQGKWDKIHLERRVNLNPHSAELVSEGIYYCHRDGEFIYDAPKEQIGTIRFQWSFVKPQDMTVAAEAVAPGRASIGGYGSTVTNVLEHGAMRRMILTDLRFGFQEEQNPLLWEEKLTGNHRWTVTPFAVSYSQWFPPYREKFLGKLWLYAPGRFTSKELFTRAHRASCRCLWKLRGLCYVALFIGWCLVFEPLSNIFRVPLLRSLLSLALASFAFVLATSCCLGCTAIARFTARPMQSILIIATVWVVIVELRNNLDESSIGAIRMDGAMGED